MHALVVVIIIQTRRIILMTYEDTWVQPNSGWICPVCGLVNAPFIPYCPCKGRGANTYSTTSTGTDAPIEKNEYIEKNTDNEYDEYNPLRQMLTERDRNSILSCEWKNFALNIESSI
jgi:hypothetical protein